MQEDYITLHNFYQVILIQGIALFAFGLAVFVWPELSYALFVVMFAVMTLVHGAMSLVHAFEQRRAKQSWVLSLLEGLLGITISIITFSSPLLTGVALIYVLAIWAVVSGVLRMISSISMRKYMDHTFLLVLIGFITVLFGIFLFKNPTVSIMFFINLIAFFGMIVGVIMIIYAHKFKKEVDNMEAVVYDAKNQKKKNGRKSNKKRK